MWSLSRVRKASSKRSRKAEVSFVWAGLRDLEGMEGKEREEVVSEDPAGGDHAISARTLRPYFSNRAQSLGRSGRAKRCVVS